MANEYITSAEFRAYLREQPTYTSDDDEFDDVRTSASRAVDVYCGRRFYQTDPATARTFRAVSSALVLVDDISTTTDLVVKSDSAGDGTFATTWTINTDFLLEPANGVRDGIEGWPYTRIVALDTKSFPILTRRPGVQVTAKWGWAAVPEPVKLATKMLALEHYRQRDTPFGVMGMGDFAMRVRANPQVALLLDPYRTAAQAIPGV